MIEEAEGDFSLFFFAYFSGIHPIFFDGLETLAILKNRIFTKFSVSINI